jgi:hypothetical protein
MGITQKTLKAMDIMSMSQSLLGPIQEEISSEKKKEFFVEKSFLLGQNLLEKIDELVISDAINEAEASFLAFQSKLLMD